MLHTMNDFPCGFNTLLLSVFHTWGFRVLFIALRGFYLLALIINMLLGYVSTLLRIIILFGINIFLSEI